MSSATQLYAQQILSSGRWVTEAQYAEFSGISRQTLSNWRFRDRKAGHDHAAAGYPAYKTFGRAVRYWLAASEIGRGGRPPEAA